MDEVGESKEVVAVKSNALLVMSVIGAIFVACMLIWVISVARKFSSEAGGMPNLVIMGWTLVIVTAAMLCFVVYLMISAIITPNEVVIVSGDKFTFCGKIHNLSDIEAVEYRRSRVRGISYPYGLLKIRLNDGTLLKCRFVADVEKVHNRLYKIIDQFKERKYTEKIHTDG